MSLSSFERSRKYHEMFILSTRTLADMVLQGEMFTTDLHINSMLFELSSMLEPDSDSILYLDQSIVSSVCKFKSTFARN